jgi:hypothetical protein
MVIFDPTALVAAARNGGTDVRLHKPVERDDGGRVRPICVHSRNFKGRSKRRSFFSPNPPPIVLIFDLDDATRCGIVDRVPSIAAVWSLTNLGLRPHVLANANCIGL